MLPYGSNAVSSNNIVFMCSKKELRSEIPLLDSIKDNFLG